MENADDFEGHRRERERLEPHIAGFAGFAQAKGVRVLEIGVGMGSDWDESGHDNRITSGWRVRAQNLHQERSRFADGRLRRGHDGNRFLAPATY